VFVCDTIQYIDLRLNELLFKKAFILYTLLLVAIHHFHFGIMCVRVRTCVSMCFFIRYLCICQTILDHLPSSFLAIPSKYNMVLVFFLFFIFIILLRGLFLPFFYSLLSTDHVS